MILKDPFLEASSVQGALFSGRKEDIEQIAPNHFKVGEAEVKLLHFIRPI